MQHMLVRRVAEEKVFGARVHPVAGKSPEGRALRALPVHKRSSVSPGPPGSPLGPVFSAVITVAVGVSCFCHFTR